GPALSRLLRPSSSPIVALLRAGEIVLDMPVSEGEGACEALIRALSEALAARLGQPGDGGRFAESALSRERLAGPGGGAGVAFPHAEVPGLARPALAFARLARGLDFDAPDGQPVRLVFLLLVPPREYDRSLQLLSAMARLLTREDVRRGLCEAADAGAVLAL